MSPQSAPYPVLIVPFPITDIKGLLILMAHSYFPKGSMILCSLYENMIANDYLSFSVAFNTVQVISRRVVLWAEETSTYSWSRFCTANCRLSVNNYQLSHVRSRV